MNKNNHTNLATLILRFLSVLRSRLTLLISFIHEAEQHEKDKEVLKIAFSDLQSESDSLHKFSSCKGAVGYFAQEALRFISIANQILEINKNPSKNSLKFKNCSHIDDISRILLRSILEGFFKNLYIFDEFAKSNKKNQLPDYSNIEKKYQDEVISEFRRDYAKLLNPKLYNNILYKKNLLTGQTLKEILQLPNAEQSWNQLPKPKDVNTMLIHVKMSREKRLDYMYFVYRVTSFDTHANGSVNVYKTAVGGKVCTQHHHFFRLDYNITVCYIAQEYLSILQTLHRIETLCSSCFSR